jgi:hypothetical protein
VRIISSNRDYAEVVVKCQRNAVMIAGTDVENRITTEKTRQVAGNVW